MDDEESGKFFKGSELSRLLVLLAIALAGWTAVWYYLVHNPAADPEPETVVTGRPEPVKPDRSLEFETVTDKTALGFRDSAAYSLLLNRSADTTAADLAAQARTDITYAHLWQDPAHYRGVPLHILGTARRIVRYESKLSRSGWLYEAWVVVPDLPKNPYVCVFEDAPKGLPIGTEVSERVVFNGFFLKLMRYQASDVERGAPLLVGRIGWTARPAGRGTTNWSAYWLAGGVAVMFSVSLVRWIMHLRRSFRPKRAPRNFFDIPNDQISPEELSEFLSKVPGDEQEKPGDQTGA